MRERRNKKQKGGGDIKLISTEKKFGLTNSERKKKNDGGKK